MISSKMNAARCMGLKAVTHQPRYRPSQTTCHATLEDTLSFYSILDVPPSASRQEIRAAYLQAMKELHPDKHRSDHASSLNDLCSVINEVYEILSDDDKREAYDVVSGFSERSLNPFMDSKVERDQLFVDEANCIGCGKCVRWAPQTFEIEASKYGRARVINQRGNTEEEVQIAIEVCPVDTIHFVSSLVASEFTSQTAANMESTSCMLSSRLSLCHCNCLY